MRQQKIPRKLSTSRIVIGQLLGWPILHVILALLTMGVSLLITLPLQILDLVLAIHGRSKRAEYERQELLAAIRSGSHTTHIS
jgi:hypothetical protein